MYDGSAASIGMTVSRAIGLQQSSLGNIGTVGNIIWLQQPGMGSIGIITCHAAWCCAHGHSANSLWHTCLPQGAMPRGPWPKIFSTLACCKVPCQGGLGQKSSAHLPATGHHAKGASAWHCVAGKCAEDFWPRPLRQPKVDTKDKPPHRGSEGKGRGRTQLA